MWQAKALSEAHRSTEALRVVAAGTLLVLAAASMVACTPVTPPTGSAPAGAQVAAKQKVRVGVLPIASASGNWIGVAKHYFEQEGIEPEITVFQTAADMIAPLGAGQLDVGAGAPGVGLAQAALRG